MRHGIGSEHSSVGLHHHVTNVRLTIQLSYGPGSAATVSMLSPSDHPLKHR